MSIRVARGGSPGRRSGVLVVAGVIAGATLSVGTAAPAWAATTVPLGVAETYSVLAGSAVIDVPPPVGPSTINSDLGVWPGNSLVGAPVVTGATHLGDAPAMQAQAALTTAYGAAAAEPTTGTISTDLGGQTLVAGAYRSPAAMALTGTLTLDAQNDPDAVFIFQAGANLTAAPDSRVTLIHGAQPCHVFWQVPTVATVNTRSRFVGTIMAQQSITLGEDVFVAGRVLARTGAVTLHHDNIFQPFCARPIVPPTLTEAFGAYTISIGETTALIFTIGNPNAHAALTDIGFTDPLPDGLVVASPNGLTGSCGGATITADAGDSGISLAGATLPAGGSCTFSVDVTGTAMGIFINTTSAIDSNESSPGGPGSASISVADPENAPILVKAFGNTIITAGETTSLTFTVSVPGDNLYYDVGFEDFLPDGLFVATTALKICNGHGVYYALGGSNRIRLGGMALIAGLPCTFTVDVIATTSGTKVNTSGPTLDGFQELGAPASANLVVVPALAPAASMTFDPALIVADGTTSLRFTVENPNANAVLTGINFVDALPSGLLVATPAAVTGSCGDGTITATAGASSISLAGANLPANGSCTFTVDVLGTTLGTKINVTGPVNATESIDGHPTAAAVTVVGALPPRLAKSFAADTVRVGESTPVTFTLTNPNTGTTLTDVSFVDALPPGLLVANMANAVTDCSAGRTVANPETNNIALSDATMAASSSCTMTVDVTATSAGTKVNTTVAVTSLQSGPGATASARITVLADPILPVTGGRYAALGTIALGLIGLGAALIVLSRRPERRRRA